MDSLVGLTIGNFQIIELTGRGGMSSVYLAADKAVKAAADKLAKETELDG